MTALAIPNSPYDTAMGRALELAAHGEGRVEPNPMVGCVVLRDGRIVGEGWHERHGETHAEVNALRSAGALAKGATLVVTLEPCCHHGKTPPCTQAVIDSGVQRVVLAMRDPNPQVDGGGVAQLEAAGIECVVGVGERQAKQLMAPYLKLTDAGRPWVIAKWAMTLDGKIATATGDSRWISGEASRAEVHRLRGRVDAVIVGAGTLLADDPLLTTRLPEGESAPRLATRIVVADDRPLPTDRLLWRTVNQGPVVACLGTNYPDTAANELRGLGVETLRGDAAGLLDQLGDRRMTNVLVEGGAKLLGGLFDHDLIDEVHAYVAPKLAGGAGAPAPIGGRGIASMDLARRLNGLRVDPCGDDIRLIGRTR